MIVNFVLDDSVLQVSVLSVLTLDMYMFFATQGCIALVHAMLQSIKMRRHCFGVCIGKDKL